MIARSPSCSNGSLDQTTTLARQEVDLAKAELAAKGKQAGLGAGMFGGATMFGLYALGVAHRSCDPRAGHGDVGVVGGLIVAAVYAVIAGGWR